MRMLLWIRVLIRIRWRREGRIHEVRGWENVGCWCGELRYQWGTFFFLFETLLPSVRAAGERERERERAIQ